MSNFQKSFRIIPVPRVLKHTLGLKFLFLFFIVAISLEGVMKLGIKFSPCRSLAAPFF
jgi:hypothetical protein